MARRTGATRDQFRALREDAENVLVKLVAYERKEPRAPRDPRLMDQNALFVAAAKRYAKECIVAQTPPSLDTLHDIAIQAANIAAEERRKHDSQPLLLKQKVRNLVSSLAVSLWHASCASPYMLNARRGADSFRPFVCGVLYALKRGAALADGTAVVPACAQLAEALPALRSTASGSAAKALHASSHRGLATLHKAISSSGANAAVRYADAVRTAELLAKAVATNSFDV
jgi:hypothetical protein